ncbi:porin family protein [Williamwhitmania taraxaci]|uniref:Opacity protein n=1 Tax=Williamwhitmania taraxaci TaxID=1640674 RepID=A0A1G6JFN9_9BACT|nr:porin family protein [Williamwhitmania taraxaci]SDC17541.1 Opacity protein [Williamwhitmania taraxaci]
MKKIYFIALLTMVGLSAFGQEYRFGIFADPQFFWLKTDSKNLESNGTRTNFNVGMALEKYFAKRYAFLTGISMNGVGGQLNYNVATTIHTSDGDKVLTPGTGVLYKLQYLSIPLGLKFCTNEIGYLTYYAHVGVTNHVLIRAKADIDAQNVSGENVRDEINLYTASYQIGAGAEYSLGGSAALQLGVTYSNGVIDVLKSSDFNAISSGVSIRVGVMF